MRRSGYAQAHRGILGPRLSELTGLQTKVLLAVLLEANPMTARYDMAAHEIAEITGVPRNKVYAALHTLDALGLLSYEPGRNQHARTTVDISAMLGRGDSASHETEQADSPASHETEQAPYTEGDNQGDKHGDPDQPILDPKALEPKFFEPVEKRTPPRDDDSRPPQTLGNFPDCMTVDSWRVDKGEFMSSRAHILHTIEAKHIQVPPADLGALGASIKACCPEGCLRKTADVCADAVIEKIGKAPNLKLAADWYRKDRGPVCPSR